MIARQQRVGMLGIGGHLLFHRFCGQARPVATESIYLKTMRAMLRTCWVSEERRERRAPTQLTTDLVQLIEQPNGVGVSGAYEDKTFLHHSC